MTTTTRTPRFTKTERITVQSVTNPAWWTSRRPVWSGIANDLRKLSKAAESNNMIDDAREWSRLAYVAESLIGA